MAILENTRVSRRETETRLPGTEDSDSPNMAAAAFWSKSTWNQQWVLFTFDQIGLDIAIVNCVCRLDYTMTYLFPYALGGEGRAIWAVRHGAMCSSILDCCGH